MNVKVEFVTTFRYILWNLFKRLVNTEVYYECNIRYYKVVILNKTKWLLD